MFVHTDTQEMPKLRHTLVLVAAATTMAALQVRRLNLLIHGSLTLDLYYSKN